MSLLTIPQVADRLSVSTKCVYKLTERGELSSYKIGKLVRIDEADVAEYLASRRIRPAQPVNVALPKKERNFALYEGRSTAKKRASAIAGYHGLKSREREA